jgi:hypothetical protein
MNQDADENIPLNERLTFCTACGENLESYCFSTDADKLEAIKKHITECRESGKFTGGVCARFFIANPDDLS